MFKPPILGSDLPVLNNFPVDEFAVGRKHGEFGGGG